MWQEFVTESKDIFAFFIARNPDIKLRIFSYQWPIKTAKQSRKFIQKHQLQTNNKYFDSLWARKSFERSGTMASTLWNNA